MVEVILHGKMAKVFGKKRFFNLERVADVFIALSANYPNFKNFIKNQKNLFFKIIIDDKIMNNDIMLYKKTVKKIEIVPLIVGSGGGVSGIFSIAIGAAMVIGGAIALATPAGPLVGVPLILGGLSLIAAGISALMTPLTPIPPAPTYQSQEFLESKGAGRSFTFGSAPQTIAEGSAVPLVYGEMLVPGQMIASEMKTIDGLDNTNTVNSVPVLEGGTINA